MFRPFGPKIHTRYNVGASGKIYFGTQQGYPKQGETLLDYRGGYPMVFDPKAGKTRVYEIPIPNHRGVGNIIPDESRGVAYLSTRFPSRPESTHFMVLDLKTGQYRDLMDCWHSLAEVVLDNRPSAQFARGQVSRRRP